MPSTNTYTKQKLANDDAQTVSSIAKERLTKMQ
jgi:hypothetical protein